MQKFVSGFVPDADTSSIPVGDVTAPLTTADLAQEGTFEGKDAFFQEGAHQTISPVASSSCAGLICSQEPRPNRTLAIWSRTSSRSVTASVQFIPSPSLGIQLTLSCFNVSTSAFNSCDDALLRLQGRGLQSRLPLLAHLHLVHTRTVAQRLHVVKRLQAMLGSNPCKPKT